MLCKWLTEFHLTTNTRDLQEYLESDGITLFLFLFQNFRTNVLIPVTQSDINILYAFNNLNLKNRQTDLKIERGISLFSILSCNILYSIKCSRKSTYQYYHHIIGFDKICFILYRFIMIRIPYIVIIVTWYSLFAVNKLCPSNIIKKLKGNEMFCSKGKNTDENIGPKRQLYVK